MRILSLQPNNNPSFGYNKALNKELLAKLKTDKSPDAITIASLNDTCNLTENNIKSLEERKEEKSVVSDLSNTLIILKAELADLISRKFPELKYSDREAKSYEKEGANFIPEMDGIDDNWRFTLANELNSPPVTKAQIDTVLELAREGKLETTGVATEFTQEGDSVKESLFEMSNAMCAIANMMIQKQAPEKSKGKGDNSLVEEFKPTDESPKGFESVGGMDELKAELKDKILDTLTDTKSAKLDKDEYGKKLPKGFLFYGPPGCGKTFIAQAVAMEAKLPMFLFKVSQAGSSYINETSKNYEKVFNLAAKKAKDTDKPVILFIDEIDGVAKDRSNRDDGEDLKQMGTLLDLIANARSRNIIVIGATNKFDLLDDAIKRRFDNQILINFPDEKARLAVLTKTLEPRTKAQKLLYNTAQMLEIAKTTDGYTNADITIIADKACDYARKDGRREVSLDDFKKSILENQGRKIKRDKFMPRSMQKPVGFPTNAVKVTNSF